MVDETYAEELTEAEVEELRGELLALRDELESALADHADNVKTVELDQPPFGLEPGK